MPINLPDGQSRQDVITALRSEMLKEYREYDVTNRLVKIIQTQSDAKDDAISLETTIVYVGATNLVKNKFENFVPWDISWEL